MSKLGTSIGVVGEPGVSMVDMRDEIITNATQFMEAIDRLRVNHPEKILAVQVSPTQEYCLRVEHLTTVFNMSENRPYTHEEIGGLLQFMGYTVVVSG